MIEFGHTCWAGASTAVDERQKAFHGAYLMQRALVTKVCKSDSARSKFSTTKKGSQSDSARSNMFAIMFLCCGIKMHLSRFCSLRFFIAKMFKGRCHDSVRYDFL